MSALPKTRDPVEALRLLVRDRRSVIVEQDGRPVAAVISIEQYERWSAQDQGLAGEASLFDDLAALGAAAPSDLWDRLPTDGAANTDQYLYGKRP